MRVLIVTTNPVELLEANMSVSGVVRIVRSVRAIADMCNDYGLAASDAMLPRHNRSGQTIR
jgi:hypothetical protein